MATHTTNRNYKQATIYWLTSLLLLSCAEAPETQAPRLTQEFETNTMSYNHDTGELQADEYTVALWHFNESRDTLLFDSSTHENDGEVLNTEWVQGRFGGGLEFKSSFPTSYVFVPHTESLNLPNAVTLEGWFWVKKYSEALNMPLIVKTTIFQDTSTYAYPNYAFWIRTQGGHADFPRPSIWWWLMGEVGEQYDYALDTSRAYKLEDLYEQWLYLVGTYNGQYSRFYVNGKLVSEKKIDGRLRTTDGGDLYIGAMKPNQPDQAHYYGILDEVRISSVARSEAAIQEYYSVALQK